VITQTEVTPFTNIGNYGACMLNLITHIKILMNEIKINVKKNLTNMGNVLKFSPNHIMVQILIQICSPKELLSKQVTQIQ